MITVKVDVSKINKEFLFQGKTAKYLDLILFESPDDKYGNDYRVVQGVSKEARAAGQKGAILGNAKIMGKTATSQPAAKSVDDAF